jgi:hypothetical protein
LRIGYSRMCRRILYGEHLEDIRTRIALQIPEVRREAWGHPDMASNPYKAVWTALSTLYDRAPSVTLTSEGLVASAQELADRAAGAGLWSTMARAQRDTLALRELWMRVSVVARPDVDDAYDPVYEPVYPDLTTAIAHADRPGVPHTIYHARLRDRPDGSQEWLWDEVSIADPDAPTYRVLRRKGDELQDLSADYPDVGAWPDVWRDGQGRPVLPYVLYHAARTPYLFDPYQTKELVEGTLNVGVLRTYVAHVARAAAWRQRYGINVQPVGAGNADENSDGKGRQRVITDPATIMLFQPMEETANTTLGTFDVPVMPTELWDYIEGYERKLIAEAGINPADQQAMAGDPRSGYALSVSRDSQREAQRRFEPQFRAGDQEVLAPDRDHAEPGGEPKLSRIRVPRDLSGRTAVGRRTGRAPSAPDRDHGRWAHGSGVGVPGAASRGDGRGGPAGPAGDPDDQEPDRRRRRRPPSRPRRRPLWPRLYPPR